MIRLEKLSREFQVGNQVVHALDEVDLVINENEYVSIMGVSGSGKSTLLNIPVSYTHLTLPTKRIV